MQSGLNFNHRKLFTILAFVSFLGAFSSHAQTSGQKKKTPVVDEFAEFDEEPIPSANGKTPVTKSAPAVATPAPTATAAPVANETPEQRVERMKATVRKDPKNITPIIDLAEEFYNQGDYKKTTLLLWKQVTKLDRRGLILLAKAHEKRNEPIEMIRALNIQLGKDEKDFEALTLLGNAQALQKKTKEALESFNSALEINAKYEPAYLGVASLYEKRTPPNWYELRIIYQDMIDHLGHKAIYVSKLCEINAKDNTFEAAASTCKEAILKDATIADNHVYLGIAQKEIGDMEAATATLKKAADKFPKSELAQYQYGKLLEDKKNYTDAMKYYKTGTEADATSARSWLGLASTSFEIRKFDIALEAYKKACKYDHKNAVAFRRATTNLRNTRNSEWSGRFESASDTCTFN